ncbi:MAG: hypothetical protein GF320_08440 [Armatimonadia bacterium]|nr:hypothetical protein [Armatimonadia bacterium]
MLDAFLSGEQRIAPDRARELFGNLVYPEGIVDLGVVEGARLRWYQGKVLRLSEDLHNAVALYAPEREGEPRILEPGKAVGLFRYSNFEGILFAHKVTARKRERQAAGSMIEIVTLTVYSAAYEFDRRRHPRVAPKSPVELEVQWVSSEEEIRSNRVSAGLRRVSMSGAGLVIPHINIDAGMSLRVGMDLDITLRLPTAPDSPVSVPATLIWAGRDPQKPGQMIVGVEWRGPSPQTIRDLAAYITMENKAALREGLQTLRTLDPRSKKRLGQAEKKDDGDRLV